MNAEEIPVNDGRWETTATAYRVYFWTLIADAVPPSAPLWRCTPLRLEATDVGEVLTWANENADGRSYTVYVEVDADPPGLMQIYGVDPTVSSS